MYVALCRVVGCLYRAELGNEGRTERDNSGEGWELRFFVLRKEVSVEKSWPGYTYYAS